ncbi:MAG TPA: DEAD/DEAH box helicase [Candidatus Omnitrophota bacterium]|nr:DEAD/DEAH box helicase [Candidatus Omnitrophota bacterium]HRY85430.1 DEAD/DEAH box helicase [Candidatus Omnitrophota bacterium]
MSFQLDPFQVQAIEWIEKEHSLLISAPTGSGKTLIAEKAVEKALSRNEQVVYTAPIKALSNQKFRDFQDRFGKETVGILTGDVSINPTAPLLIMTTEIYRNSLFENTERIQKIGWVIFDEVHYLDDVERGTVWEEALLFTPPEVRILALSATIPNVQELAAWIRQIHERPIAVIEETHRPVPLHFLFQCQGKILTNTKSLRKEGYFQRDNWQLSHRERRRGFQPPRARPNRLHDILRHLIEQDQLPALYFAFGRKRTALLAWEISHFDLLRQAERREIRTLYDELLKRYDLTGDKTAEEIRPLVEQGIAYHHAGMLPTLKEVIERLFTSRLIKLIFTTETFALGINMPARTVVFDELEKFYGTGFKPLTTRDFFQMAGRAGRRGMDPEGFVYCRIHPNDIAFPEVERILYGRPEPVRSQLNTAYATLLNLYRTLGHKLLEIYPRSFHFFQSSKRKREEGLELLKNKLALLQEMGYITDQGLTIKGEFAASIFGYELLLTEMYTDGALEQLDEAKLNVFLAGLIFEPRKNDEPPRLGKEHAELLKMTQHYHRMVHKWESNFRITPYTKPPHFHLARAVEAWTQGKDFEKTCQMTATDEGSLVRYLRMVIQLLREIANAPHASAVLKSKARRARELIDRDVVDAEKQLRA